MLQIILLQSYSLNYINYYFNFLTYIGHFLYLIINFNIIMFLHVSNLNFHLAYSLSHNLDHYFIIKNIINLTLQCRHLLRSHFNYNSILNVNDFSCWHINLLKTFKDIHFSSNLYSNHYFHSMTFNFNNFYFRES
jgi:hypothetical protein